MGSKKNIQVYLKNGSDEVAKVVQSPLKKTKSRVLSSVHVHGRKKPLPTFSKIKNALAIETTTEI
jgi:hypothetical protein